MTSKNRFALVKKEKNAVKLQKVAYTLFCIYAGWIYCKFYFLIAEIWDFCHICEQIQWKIVRRWHHQLTYLHIHIECSRNVSWKIVKLYNFISCLFFNPIFIKFSLICLKLSILSIELIQTWTGLDMALVVFTLSWSWDGIA